MSKLLFAKHHQITLNPKPERQAHGRDLRQAEIAKFGEQLYWPI
jgi:hypothetical protein